MCDNNQVLINAIANMVQGRRAKNVPPPVCDAADETFVHKYVDNEGNNQLVQLMFPAELLAFYKDVLKLEDAQILELKTGGLEYPRDFASFDSELVEATIKSMQSKNLVLSGLSQMQLKTVL